MPLTFSSNPAVPPDFTPILIQPWRDLSFQNISWSRAGDLPDFSPIWSLPPVHWNLCTKEGHQDFICMTQKDFSQPISKKNRSTLLLEDFYADSNVNNAKKEKAKKAILLPDDDCPESTHEGSRWHTTNRCWVYKKVSRASTCKSTTHSWCKYLFFQPHFPLNICKIRLKLKIYKSLLIGVLVLQCSCVVLSCQQGLNYNNWVNN